MDDLSKADKDEMGMSRFKGKKQSNTIRTRIVTIFTILVIMPFLLLTGFAFTMFGNYSVSNILEATDDSMSMISYQVRSSIKEYEELSMALYYNECVDTITTTGPLSARDKAQIEAALQSCCLRTGVRSAYLITDHEVLYQGSYYPEILTMVESHQKEITGEGGACLWYPTNELHGSANETTYVLARSLNSQNEKNVGILYLIIDESMVKNAFGQMQSEYATRYLTTADGKIIYSSEPNDFGKTIDVSGIDPKVRSSVRVSHGLFNRDTVLVSRKIMRTGWYCVSLFDTSVFPHNVMNLIVPFIIFVAIYLIFLFAMLYMLSRYIFSPLKRLTNAMDDYAQGRLEVIRMEPVGTGEFRNISEHFNNMGDRIQKLITDYKDEVDEKNRQKMKALTMQLTPHFIYNALNTIKWMALLNHQENIQHLTESLIYIFMNAAKVDDNDYSVDDELKLIENYAVIQKARFMDFDLIIECDDESRACNIRKFLLQPIVENAIIHGLGRGQVKNSVISVRVWSDSNLNIIIHDDGIGFDYKAWKENPEHSEEHSNIGIKSIEEIIRLEYGDPYCMVIDSTPGQGTTVSYTLPKIKGEKP